MQSVLSLVLLLAAFCNAQFQSFLSRPDITGAVDIQILQPPADPAALAPGYYFITPYLGDFNSAAFGPCIYDYTGQLIWYGNLTVQVRGQDLHVCDYNDHAVGTHLCYNDALPVAQGGHSAGNIRFFDNTYTEVTQEFGAANGLAQPDIHELNTPNAGDGSSFIQESYEMVTMDLTAYDGPVDGIVWNGCFQVIDFNSRDSTFQWCALDHVGLNETYTYMEETVGQYFSPISGNGSEQAPWDYVHLNAIDLTYGGDYLVSLRHTDTIYKVAGPNTASGVIPGDIIWRMGGKLSNFTLDGFNFSRQHAVRSDATTDTTDDLTLFDNASDGKAQSSSSSSGKRIHVDSTTMTATLVTEYDAPDGDIVSSSQGDVQTLPNGNTVVGWGSAPFFSEYDNAGNILYHAHFGFEGNDFMQNYRAWKYPWVATPTEPPVILAYAQNCSGELYAYASWNGATEVATWRFHKGQSETGTMDTTTTDQARTGFETLGDLGTFAPYVFAEALDVNGNVIGTSATNATFVPNDASAGSCTEQSCDAGFVYDSSSAQTCGGQLNLGQVFDILPAAPPNTDVPKEFQGIPEPPT